MQDSNLSAAAGGKRLISSREVEGAAVYDADGMKVGSIDHLVIERVSGQVAYAVVVFGGFLGRLKSHYRLPWPMLKYDTKLDGYRAIAPISRKNSSTAPLVLTMTATQTGIGK
ncbi:MAG: PRC-barrel domain-containing protein [Rhodomicrobium sp.]